MSITARLESERGEEIGFASDGDTINELVAMTDDSFICWRFIDPYGDTIFNSLQAPVVIEELDLLQGAGGTEPQGVRRLAEQCRDGTHLYLRFIGD